jgi:hypothetical protein
MSSARSGNSAIFSADGIFHHKVICACRYVVTLAIEG